MGTITKRGNKYRLRIRRKNPNTGKLVDFSRTFATLPKARAFERATEVAIDNGEYQTEGGSASESEMTFEGFLEDVYTKYLKAHHSRPEETLVYLRRFNLGSRRLSEIRRRDIVNWRTDRLTGGLKASTINRQVSAIHAALHRAVEWEYIRENPIQGLKRLKVDKQGVIRYLNDQEKKDLLSALAKRDADARDARERGNAWQESRGYELRPVIRKFCDDLTPKVLVAMQTGMRYGEINQLTWADVDFDAKRITVRGDGTKSKQTRFIPMNQIVLDALREHRDEPSRLIRENDVFASKSVKKSFAKVLESSGIKSFRWHDLRHTFASRLAMASVPLYTVKELLGHASLRMTERYAHISDETMVAAVRQLD